MKKLSFTAVVAVLCSVSNGAHARGIVSEGYERIRQSSAEDILGALLLLISIPSLIAMIAALMYVGPEVMRGFSDKTPR